MLLRRWNDKEVLEVIVILIIIHVVIQVEKEHSSDLTADVAHQQPPGSNLAGWIFLQAAAGSSSRGAEHAYRACDALVHTSLLHVRS